MLLAMLSVMLSCEVPGGLSMLEPWKQTRTRRLHSRKTNHGQLSEPTRGDVRSAGPLRIDCLPLRVHCLQHCVDSCVARLLSRPRHVHLHAQHS
jgi:hypothetical protein